MSLVYESVSQRAQFNFAVEGLSAREELLLKSMIRLLDHRTKHAWSYDTDSADLWIVDQVTNVPGQAKQRRLQPKIVILNTLQSAESVSSPSSGAVALRLNAKILEETLNQAGDSLIGLVQIEHDVSKVAVASPSLSVSNLESYRLSRWPTSHMLVNPTHIRIAALLVGTPLTITQIADKSGKDLAMCQVFIDQLKQAGLLMVSQPTAQENLLREHLELASASNVAPVKPLSIFARIRNRLALSI
jgi:hypothetical protein